MREIWIGIQHPVDILVKMCWANRKNWAAIWYSIWISISWFFVVQCGAEIRCAFIPFRGFDSDSCSFFPADVEQELGFRRGSGSLPRQLPLHCCHQYTVAFFLEMWIAVVEEWTKSTRNRLVLTRSIKCEADGWRRRRRLLATAIEQCLQLGLLEANCCCSSLLYMFHSLQ